MEGKIVLETKSEKNIPITLRYPKFDDAQVMTEYVNKLSAEKTYVSFQGETITLEEETNFLKSMLEKLEKGRNLFILAFSGDKLIGIGSIEMMERAKDHVGLFGISIAKGFRSQGIGKILMQTVLAEAKQVLPTLKLCILGVFSDNPTAQHIYEKMGFKVSGSMPKALKHRDHFDDEIWMYKEL